jgi:acyl-CoA thioester hydrolase
VADVINADVINNDAQSSIFTMQFRVYVQDTDCIGVVYHANYLNYMERARTEHLIKAGYSLADLATRNLYFAVRRAVIEYHKPAKLDQIIQVTSQITRFGKSSLVFMQTVKHNEHLLCTAEITLVCINAQAQPIRVPQDIKEKFA